MQGRGNVIVPRGWDIVSVCWASKTAVMMKGIVLLAPIYLTLYPTEIDRLRQHKVYGGHDSHTHIKGDSISQG